MALTTAERSKRWRTRHPERMKNRSKYQRQRLKAYKEDVMTHYGGGVCRCVNCGESRLACLTIDHVNHHHAPESKDKRLHGKGLYSWLKSHKYPMGYQTLCMNCQWVKRVTNGEEGRRLP